jgi:hypothetical protein
LPKFLTEVAIKRIYTAVMRCNLLTFILSLSVTLIDSLRVPLSLRPSHNVGFSGYPISVVVPFPKGNNYTISKLGVKGKPTQIEVLERWPSDKSLRNILVHFQASYSPSNDTNEVTQYFLVDRSPPIPKINVTASENSEQITVDTRKIRFTIKKKNSILLTNSGSITIEMAFTKTVNKLFYPIA